MSKEMRRNLKWTGVVIGIAYLLLQHRMYLWGHTLAGYTNITSFSPKIPLIDDAIPIISIFILPYIWSYVFWAMGPMAVSRCEQSHFKDYLMGCVISMVAGMIVLIFAPTYMDRVAEGLFAVQDKGVFDRLREFWYGLDGGDMAYNLLPSFHCLNSTMCFLGVMGRKEISKGFRIYTFVMAVMIIASTQFVKQHFVMDAFAGVALALISYAIAKKFRLGRIIPFNI